MPRDKRPVIKDGIVLPVNKVTTMIASKARIPGPLTIMDYGRTMTYMIRYVDATKIIVS